MCAEGGKGRVFFLKLVIMDLRSWNLQAGVSCRSYSGSLAPPPHPGATALGLAWQVDTSQEDRKLFLKCQSELRIVRTPTI